MTWQGLFATSGTNIQTSKGRYLVPLVVRDAHGVISARNAYSDDAGKTWKVGQSLGAGTDESHAIELKGGTILQNIRDGYTRLVARSPDGGITFSNPEPDPALIDPKCNAGIAHFKRGRQDILIFTNAASRKRENLTVRLSFDGGHTWPNAKILAAGPAGYSTVVPLRDGTIAVLYERGAQVPRKESRSRASNCNGSPEPVRKETVLKSQNSRRDSTSQIPPALLTWKASVSCEGLRLSLHKIDPILNLIWGPTRLLCAGVQAPASRKVKWRSLKAFGGFHPLTCRGQSRRLCRCSRWTRLSCRRMNILFIGDIFASAGRSIVAEHLSLLVPEHKIDLRDRQR